MLGWLRPTPAEAVGLAVLVTGAVLATLLWWGQSVAALPDPAGAGAGAGGGVTDAASVGAAVDARGGADGPAPGVEAEAAAHGHAYATGPDADTAPGPGSAPDPGAVPASGSGAAGPGPVVVHLSGAVVAPGLVELPAGGRVGAAVLAAGGLTAEADTDRINLARPVTDGEHVHVPRRGEELPVPAPGSPAVTGPADTGPTDGLIDLNRATAAEFETLPGIGPSRAAAIVQHRERHGPFRVPGDLRAVSGIGEATFQNLAPLVVVR